MLVNWTKRPGGMNLGFCDSSIQRTEKTSGILRAYFVFRCFFFFFFLFYHRQEVECMNAAIEERQCDSRLYLCQRFLVKCSTISRKFLPVQHGHFLSHYLLFFKFPYIFQSWKFKNPQRWVPVAYICWNQDLFFCLFFFFFYSSEPESQISQKKRTVTFRKWYWNKKK